MRTIFEISLDLLVEGIVDRFATDMGKFALPVDLGPLVLGLGWPPMRRIAGQYFYAIEPVVELLPVLDEAVDGVGTLAAKRVLVAMAPKYDRFQARLLARLGIDRIGRGCIDEAGLQRDRAHVVVGLVQNCNVTHPDFPLDVAIKLKQSKVSDKPMPRPTAAM
jgi:hypothetical protein